MPCRQLWTGPWRSSLALAAAVTVAALTTLLGDGVLRGTEVMNGSARGTALVMSVGGLPALLGGAIWTRRTSSLIARCVWLGATGYLVYNSVLLNFATPVNRAFLAYVACLGLGLLTLVLLMARIRSADYAPRSTRARDRMAAGFIAFIVLANALVWLRAVVPTVTTTEAPSFLDGTGLTTNPIYVQDLAWWLPLLGVVAWWLWSGRSVGRLLGGAGLVGWTLEAATVAVDQTWGHHADPTSTVATAGGAWLFAVLGVMTAGVTVAFLDGLRRLR